VLVTASCREILWKKKRPKYIWSSPSTHYALFLCAYENRLHLFSRFYRFKTYTAIILLSTLLYDMSSYVWTLNEAIWSLFTYNKLQISFKICIYKEQNTTITYNHNNIVYHYYIIIYVIVTIILYFKGNV